MGDERVVIQYGSLEITPQQENNPHKPFLRLNTDCDDILTSLKKKGLRYATIHRGDYVMLQLRDEDFHTG